MKILKNAKTGTASVLLCPVWLSADCSSQLSIELSKVYKVVVANLIMNDFAVLAGRRHPSLEKSRSF